MLAAQACLGARNAIDCPSPWLLALHRRVRARSADVCPHLSHPLPPRLATCTLALDLHCIATVKTRSHARPLCWHSRVRQDLQSHCAWEHCRDQAGKTFLLHIAEAVGRAPDQQLWPLESAHRAFQPRGLAVISCCSPWDLNQPLHRLKLLMGKLHSLCRLKLLVGRLQTSGNTLAIGTDHHRGSQPRGLLQLQPDLATRRPHCSPPPSAFAMRTACVARPVRTLLAAAMLHYHNLAVTITSTGRAACKGGTIAMTHWCHLRR